MSTTISKPSPMPKKALTYTTMLALILSLAGCAGDSQTSTTSTTTTESTSVQPATTTVQQ